MKFTEDYLDSALSNAKKWCSESLSKHLEGYSGGFDFSIFYYIIDNEMIPDMCLDEEVDGLIRVSLRKIKWYLDREEFFKEHNIPYSEYDVESTFTHEMIEYLVHKDKSVYLDYIKKFGLTTPHKTALMIENINRKERGLNDWID